MGYPRASSLPSLYTRPDAEVFDVRAFGARGNGVVDDTASFVKALAAASERGGIVQVPEGSYVVQRMLRVGTNVRLKGVGPASILKHDLGDPIVVAALGVSSCAVEDIAITGRFAHGVLFERCVASSLARCRIEGGIIPRYGYSSGAYVVVSRDITIEECTFDGNGGGERQQGADIQCDGLGHKSGEIRIVGNRCRSIGVAANIRCFDTSRSEISRNVVSGARLMEADENGVGNNHGYGIVIYESQVNSDSCVDNAVLANEVSDTQGSGIYLVKAHRAHVSGNVINRVAHVQRDESLPVAGIALNRSRAVTVTHNQIADVGRAGISIVQGAVGADQSEISDNEIMRAGGYGIHLRGPSNGIRVVRNSVSATNGGIGGDTSDLQTDLLIADNVLTRTRRVGIRLWHAQRSAIRNNTVRDPDGYVLDLAVDEASEVAGNVLSRAGVTSIASEPDEVRLVRRAGVKR